MHSWKLGVVDLVENFKSTHKNPKLVFTTFFSVSLFMLFSSIAFSFKYNKETMIHEHLSI